jgi:hypothetical protein
VGFFLANFTHAFVPVPEARGGKTVVTERHLFVRNLSKNGLRPFLFYKFYKFRRKSPFVFNSLRAYRVEMGTEKVEMGTKLQVDMGSNASPNTTHEQDYENRR